MTDRPDFGPVRDEAELGAQAANEALAFNTPLDTCVAWLRSNRDDVRVIRRGGEVVGGLVLYRMGQFLGGRSVRNAGIGGVAIDPTVRGRGAAKAMMASTLNELHGDGIAVSTLYPTTYTLYGRAGYAVAGHRYRFRLPLDRIGRISADGGLRRIDRKADQPELDRLYRRQASGRNGWLDRNRFIWGRVWRDLGGKDTHGYVVPGEDGRLDGYVVYTQGPAGSYPYDIRVRDVQTADARAAGRILALFADCRTLARSVTWYGALDDHLLLQAPEVGVGISVSETWMLRIVDLQAALAERGYPPASSTRLTLEVTDDVIAANQGQWELRVDAGRAEVGRAGRNAGRGTLRLDIRALAQLWTGYLGASRLAALGRLEGTPAAVQEADRLFAGPPPSMPDDF